MFISVIMLRCQPPGAGASYSNEYGNLSKPREQRCLLARTIIGLHLGMAYSFLRSSLRGES